MLKKIFLLVIISSNGFAQSIPIPNKDIQPKNYICYKANDAITVDGDLKESDWQHAEWTDYFADIEGDAKPAPRFGTRAKMLWDDDYFYVAAELSEPDIWAKLMNRDDIIFYDNDFEVFIDPDGNTHGYVEFEMNAFNTVWDLFLIQPYRDINKAALHQFDIKDLKTGVQVYGTLNQPGDEDSSWTVEIAFPWKGLNEVADIPMPPDDKDQWRVNFSRVEWKTEVKEGVYEKQINPQTNKSYPEDNWVWSPQGVVNMHYPEMWGYVQFSETNVGSGKVEFIYDEKEEAKRFLRDIYYNQKVYLEKHGEYSADLQELNMAFPNIPGFSTEPVIEITTNYYEAKLKADCNSHSIHIRSDGLTWETAGK